MPCDTKGLDTEGRRYKYKPNLSYPSQNLSSPGKGCLLVVCFLAFLIASGFIVLDGRYGIRRTEPEESPKIPKVIYLGAAAAPPPAGPITFAYFCNATVTATRRAEDNDELMRGCNISELLCLVPSLSLGHLRQKHTPLLLSPGFCWAARCCLRPVASRHRLTTLHLPATGCKWLAPSFPRAAGRKSPVRAVQPVTRRERAMLGF